MGPSPVESVVHPGLQSSHSLSLSFSLSLRGHLKSFGVTHKIQEFNCGLTEDRFKGETRLEGSSYNSESIIIVAALSVSLSLSLPSLPHVPTSEICYCYICSI